MLLHTLEQTFQAGAVRSRRAYFFYILPFRLSFFACCCHVDPYVLYLFLAYCIQQEGKKLEMRRPVDIDAICLFWLKTDSNAPRLGASSPSRLARYTATMTVSNWHCLLVAIPTTAERELSRFAWQARSIDGAGGRPLLLCDTQYFLRSGCCCCYCSWNCCMRFRPSWNSTDGQNQSTAHGHSKRYASAGAPRDAGLELLYSLVARIWDWADRMDM
jgi:hypothetical protein